MKTKITVTLISVYLFLAAFSLVYSTFAAPVSVPELIPTVTVTETAPKEKFFTVRSLGGRVAVEDEDGNIVLSTSTRVAILPETDREQLENGIRAKNPREVKRILEDLCS